VGNPSGKIGGRYRTVSCAVALYQNNSGQLITIEADPDVLAIHQVILVVGMGLCPLLQV
jgi:hypothetical protein